MINCKRVLPVSAIWESGSWCINIFFLPFERCTVALLLLLAMQKCQLCFELWLNLHWAQASSLDTGQIFPRRLKGRRAHPPLPTPYLQAMKLRCWGSHKSNYTIFLYYIIHSVVCWQQYLPKGVIHNWHEKRYANAIWSLRCRLFLIRIMSLLPQKCFKKTF